MKRAAALLLLCLMVVLCFASCRTLEDTKPQNETATPNCVYFVK